MNNFKRISISISVALTLTVFSAIPAHGVPLSSFVSSSSSSDDLRESPTTEEEFVDDRPVDIRLEEAVTRHLTGAGRIVDPELSRIARIIAKLEPDWEVIYGLIEEAGYEVDSVGYGMTTMLRHQGEMSVVSWKEGRESLVNRNGTHMGVGVANSGSRELKLVILDFTPVSRITE